MNRDDAIYFSRLLLLFWHKHYLLRELKASEREWQVEIYQERIFILCKKDIKDPTERIAINLCVDAEGRIIVELLYAKILIGLVRALLAYIKSSFKLIDALKIKRCPPKKFPYSKFRVCENRVEVQLIYIN